MAELSPQKLILATESTYKIELLERLGLSFEACAAHIDETRLPGEAPAAMAARLALQKARRVAADHPNAFVLGADQVIALDQTIFQKPGSVEGAVDQLMRLQGKTHRLITAIALRTPSGAELASEVAFEMVMRPLTEQRARAYVETDQPLFCAGSYRIEAGGIRLFEAARGDDFTAIIGLPLTRVWSLLEQTGYLETL
ncbi:septum formation protein Maf [Lujinxingia sediminis]|uniref:7-methyl-GTP pyrophosphatase n=1 Tax=Lujinxingia sediminis TaxID=2480984 RepID=A0ABY0CSZ0_9DELT|nr:nucleoside triphosphate pyrophosphatase [Lujinxingia sediminis]RVU44147.1 septum formation protein Maf [Lujinxingia sediminis]